MASDEWIAENVKKDDDDVWERDDELPIDEGRTLEITEETITREEINATHERQSTQEEILEKQAQRIDQLENFWLGEQMRNETEAQRDVIGEGELVRGMSGKTPSKDYSDNQLRAAGWSDEQIADLKGKSIEQLDTPLEPLPSKSKLNKMKKAKLVNLANTHGVDITPKQDSSTGKTRPLFKGEIIERLLK
jgi:hypothetical protein